MKTREINPFGLRMTPEIRDYVAKKAEKEERSQNWLICKILKEAMERELQIKQA